MKSLAIVLAAVVLAGCASYKPVPDDYTGPVATITDTGVSEGRTKAQLFVVSAIDGNHIENSVGASSKASQGQGFKLTTQVIERQIPARPMKVTLWGTHTTAAPIQALFSQAAGKFYSVEGTVEFTPKANGRYVVKGELKKQGSSVWIEDAENNQVVTEKVVKKQE